MSTQDNFQLSTPRINPHVSLMDSRGQSGGYITIQVTTTAAEKHTFTQERPLRSQPTVKLGKCHVLSGSVFLFVKSNQC